MLNYLLDVQMDPPNPAIIHSMVNSAHNFETCLTEMWRGVWLMVGVLGRWVGAEKEELDLVPSGCCDWPSCYDPRTQVGMIANIPLYNIQILIISFALTLVAHCGLSAPPNWSSSAATASIEPQPLKLRLTSN